MFMVVPNPRVYQAAREFAQGEPIDKIEKLLLNCVDFDEDDVSKVVNSSKSYCDDVDGGYSAFINTVNLVLQTKAYRLEYTKKKHISII
jgi:hypothetical protein